VCIIPPKDSGSFPAVDIREFVDTPTYTGPTKKGIRFSWERLNEVAELLEQQGKCILDVGSYSPRTSSDTASTPGKSVTQKPAVHRERDQVLQQVIPDGPKKFPHDFVNPSKKFSPPMELPSESIELVQKPDGKFHVSSELGFSLPVKNAVQGNYVVYAHRRGGHSVELPTDMIEIFRSVKAYENYLRELKHSLIQAYLRKSGHRPTAEHRVKEVFKTHGLPWLPDS
ncbi:MAG: transcriptional coactivator p15/PC4 family protein, partial [Deltaproteobacteria bacterium]|nr:transcriptional coactivator p15/PC4 family protein [Deltaproteobacteria bacterium]